MFDHLIKCASDAERQALLEQYGVSRAAPVSVITADAVWDTTDPEEPVLVTPEVTLEGYWLAVALPEVSNELKALPDGACRLIADREAAKRGEDFLIWVSPVIDPEILTTARVSPVIAGSRYPFGHLPT